MTPLSAFLATLTDSSDASTSFTSGNLIVILYVKGIFEKFSRVLRYIDVLTDFKPFYILHARFPWPKDKPPTLHLRSVVYKIFALTVTQLLGFSDALDVVQERKVPCLNTGDFILGFM